MDEKRKGEIGLALLKYQLGRKRLNLSMKTIMESLKKELDNVTEATGIPLDELKEFRKLFLEEILEETFEEICQNQAFCVILLELCRGIRPAAPPLAPPLRALSLRN